MQPENTKHVVIVGAPDGYVESLVIVVGEERAVPLFDSVEEAREFLESLSGVSEWFPAEIPSKSLREMLESQPDDMRYVALSPPPEDLAGGMEFRLLEIGSLTALLSMQAMRNEEEATANDEPPERRSLLRRILGR